MTIDSASLSLPVCLSLCLSLCLSVSLSLSVSQSLSISVSLFFSWAWGWGMVTNVMKEDFRGLTGVGGYDTESEPKEVVWLWHWLSL